MTQDRKRQQGPIRLLVDLLAEDILAASDAEILAEMREDGDDPDRAASDMRGLFERALILSNKSRLATARAAVAAERQSRGANSRYCGRTAPTSRRAHPKRPTAHDGRPK
jgi:hypothetical protein